MKESLQLAEGFIQVLHRASRLLYSLTETDFGLEEVVERCRRRGWRPSEVDPSLGVARFRLDDGREAVVTSREAEGSNGRASLWLPLYYWPDEEDDYVPARQEGRETGVGREDFDARFEVACDQLTESLGPPTARGKFECGHRPGWPYSYAVWRGKRGFVVLQQDKLDIQFGFDISVWVLSGSKGEELPPIPLTAENSKGEPSAWSGPTDPLWDHDLDG
jgi:hypothetical protein